MIERTQYSESFRQQALEKVYTRDSRSVRTVAADLRRRSWSLLGAAASQRGTVRVDREGIGCADLAIGVPTNVVAGAGFGTLQVVFDLTA